MDGVYKPILRDLQEAGEKITDMEEQGTGWFSAKQAPQTEIHHGDTESTENGQ
jgi:hypothetical protein